MAKKKDEQGTPAEQVAELPSGEATQTEPARETWAHWAAIVDLAAWKLAAAKHAGRKVTIGGKVTQEQFKAAVDAVEKATVR